VIQAPKTERRILRYDKVVADYLAFIKLASIRLWLRAYESAPFRNCDGSRGLTAAAYAMTMPIEVPYPPPELPIPSSRAAS